MCLSQLNIKKKITMVILVVVDPRGAPEDTKSIIWDIEGHPIPTKKKKGDKNKIPTARVAVFIAHPLLGRLKTSCSLL